MVCSDSPPPILEFPLPPSNLTMPELSVLDGEIYFVVAEIFIECPVSHPAVHLASIYLTLPPRQGHGAFIDVGVSYSAIQYSGSTAINRDEVVSSDATAIEYGL